MSDVNKQLLEALRTIASGQLPDGDGVNTPTMMFAEQAIAAAEQAQQITDNTRVAWTSLGTVKAMLPELLASDDVKVRENAQIIDALVKLVGNQQAQQAEPVARDVLMALAVEVAQRMVAVSAVASIDDWQKMVGLPAIVDRYATQPPAVADRDAIRRIFMAHGFTIKDGQTDLKPYVYEAAEALLRELSPAVAVPDERAAFEEWLQENIDDTDTVRPSKEKVDAYFAVWLARAMLAAQKGGK